MGFWDKLLGRDQPQSQPQRQPQQPYGNQGYYGQGGQYGQGQYGQQGGQGQPNQPLTDEQAVDRYRYMLRTAPPETIEQAHAQAFAQLTPEQRRMVLENLSAVVPPAERANSDDPQSLARMATRAEVRQPGTLERTFGSMGAPSMGGLMAGSFLSSMAGVFLGTMIAQSFFGGFGGNNSGYAEGYQDAQQAEDAQGAEDSGDHGDAGADYGSDFGDFGGDFGGDF